MMVRMILHHHLDTIELFCRNNAGMVVGKSQGRQAKQHISRLLQIFIDSIGGTNQKDYIPRKTVPQCIG